MDTLPSGRRALIVPSILAGDFSKLGSEAAECSDLGSEWLHVDICDGLGGHTITLGPQAVESLKRSCPLLLDCHLSVFNDIDYIEPLASAGAGRLSFQWELLGKTAGKDDTGKGEVEVKRLDIAVKLAQKVAALGLKCGIAIGRSTPLEGEVAAFLEQGLVDYVNCLAVEPGLGGQKMDVAVLDKVKAIRHRFPLLPFLVVDGGVNEATARGCAEAGANVLVAGSYILGSDRRADRRAAVEGLRRTLRQYGQ